MIKLVLVLVLLSAPFSWAGDEVSKPCISTTETINVTAKVGAINHETAEVTLLLGLLPIQKEINWRQYQAEQQVLLER